MPTTPRICNREGCTRHVFARAKCFSHYNSYIRSLRRKGSTLFAAVDTWAELQKAMGRKAFGDRFLAPYYGSGSGLTGRSLDRPIGTITTRDRWAVIDGDRMRMMSVPEARTGMGFRSTYYLPDDPRLAMHLLGNAVPPPMAHDVIAEMRRAA